MKEKTTFNQTNVTIRRSKRATSSSQRQRHEPRKDDCVEGKENEALAKKNKDKDDDDHLHQKRSSSSSSSSSCAHPSKSQFVQDFLSAARHDTCQAAFWSAATATSLAQCVVLASQQDLSPPSWKGRRSGSRQRQKTRNITELLLLEEQQVDLTKSARAVIKQATEAKTEEHNNRQTMASCLLVGIHLLRALATQLVVSSSSQTKQQQQQQQQDALIRLLYHAIMTADGWFASVAKQTDEKDDSGSLQQQQQTAALYALAAYHSLGHVLTRNTMQVASSASSRSTATTTSVRQFSILDDKEGQNDDPCSYLFPIPREVEPTKDESKKKTSQKNGTLPPDKLSAIVMLSTLSMIRMIGTLASTRQLVSKATTHDKKQNQPAMFGDYLAAIWQEPVHLLIHLVQRVWMPWIPFHAVAGTGSTTSMVKDIISQSKQIHRILWDAATRLEHDREHAASRALQLRKHAILALIHFDDQVPDTIRQELVRDFFETACTYAYKAAVSHVTSTNNNNKDIPAQMKHRPATSEALCEFHQTIGSILDDTIIRWDTTESEQSSSPLLSSSLSYAQYCFYRALQKGRPENRSECQFCCAASQPCLFRFLPYRYVHGNCHSSGKSAVMAAILFLTISVRDELKKGCSVQCSKLDRDVEPLSDDFLETARATITEFHTFFSLRTDLELPSPSRLKTLQTCFKMLWSIALHWQLYESVNGSPTSDSLASEPMMDRHKQFLEVGANILVECMAPLIVDLLKNDKGLASDDKRVAALWENITECYGRAVSAFEVLNSNECNKRADSIMNEFVACFLEIEATVPPPKSCIEKAAKVSPS